LYGIGKDALDIAFILLQGRVKVRLGGLFTGTEFNVSFCYRKGFLSLTSHSFL
jgi:hypothetical protein